MSTQELITFLALNCFRLSDNKPKSLVFIEKLCVVNYTFSEGIKVLNW